MQAQVRFLSVFLLLALAAPDFAQPAPGAIGEGGQPANTNVIRRFRRTTNAALDTNQPAPAAAQTTPAQSVPTLPAFPSPPVRPRRTNVVTTPTDPNLAPATNVPVVGAVGATQTTVVEQGAAAPQPNV